MTNRKLVLATAAAVTLVFLGAGFGAAPQAQVLPIINPADFNTKLQVIGQSSNSPILEGQQPLMAFTVMNNTANFLILDEAILTFGNALPDGSDNPFNPFNVSFAPFIAPGGVGIYRYGAATGEIDPGDFGVTPVSFQIFMSEIAGAPTSLPPVINTLAPCPPPAQQVGCVITTFFEPFLNPPFLIGPQHEADNFANLLQFTVNDTPEPSVLSLVAIGGLGLLGLRRWRNRAA